MVAVGVEIGIEVAVEIGIEVAVVVGIGIGIAVVVEIGVVVAVAVVVVVVVAVAGAVGVAVGVEIAVEIAAQAFNAGLYRQGGKDMKKVIAAMVMVGMLVAMVMAGTCLADGNDPWKLVVIFLQPEGLPGNMPTPVLSTTPFMTYGACEAASAFIETWQANLGVYYGIYTQTSCVKD